MRVGMLAVGVLSLWATGAAADDALLSAVAARRAEEVKKLLSAGADVNARDDVGRTALHLAVENDDAETIEVLLRGGAPIDATSGVLESTPLADAVLGKKRNAVLALLRHRPDLEYVTLETPLAFLAAQHADGFIMKALVDAGMDVRRSVTHRTATNVNPLMAAAGAGNAEAVKVLLETSVDVNQRDGYGDHCLNWAIYFGQFHVVPVLLDSPRKVELDFVGYGRQTALDMAIAKDHAPTIELLRKRGAKRARDL